MKNHLILNRDNKENQQIGNRICNNYSKYQALLERIHDPQSEFSNDDLSIISIWQDPTEKRKDIFQPIISRQASLKHLIESDQSQTQESNQNINQKQKQTLEIILKQLRQSNKKLLADNYSLKNQIVKLKAENQNKKFQPAISAIYRNAFIERKMPEPTSFIKALQSYFNEFEQMFVKINFMFQNLENVNNSDNMSLDKIKNIVNLLKIPVIYKNNPKIFDSLKKTSNKNSKITNKNIMCTSLGEEQIKPSLLQYFSPQLFSISQTFNILEKILRRIISSNITMKMLKSNRVLMEYIKRIKNEE